MTPPTSEMHRYSEQFLPAFAVLKGVQRGHSGARYAPLDVHLDEDGPVAAAGEHIVGRWLCLGGAMITATAAGTPIGMNGIHSGSPVKLFDGPCDIMLTDRRLVILVLDGPTAVAKIGGRTGLVLVAVFPLEKVDYAEVELKQGFRGARERLLTIGNMTGGLSALVVNQIEMVWEHGRFASARGTKYSDILEALVSPVVAARRPGATGPELAQLNDVVAGTRIRTASEMCVQFVPE